MDRRNSENKRKQPPRRREIEEGGRRPTRHSQGRRPPRHSRPKRRRSWFSIIFMMVLLIAAAVAVIIIGNFFWEHYSRRYRHTDERADLNIYFEIGNENEVALIMDNVVIREGASRARARFLDGTAYLEISLVNERVNNRFHWDYNERILIHTLPYGSVVVAPDTREYINVDQSVSVDYTILIQEGGNMFLALPFIQKFADIEFAVYDTPNRVVINTNWEDRTVAFVRRNSAVRFQGGIRSAVLTNVYADDEVTILEVEGDWRKVATVDGFIGYIEYADLENQEVRTFNRTFEEPVFTRIVKDHPLNIGWDDVNNIYANAFVGETLSRSRGLTAIAPMWLSVADTSGNIDSIATSEYVETAHAAGVEVWVTLRDFHGGINSETETYQTISFTSNRTRIIEQTIAETLRVGADGINLDFEKVPVEAGSHFIQLVRELSVESRKNNLLLSVANFYPFPWRAHYNIAEQARVVDYIILMGYDEYFEGSPTAGPVASFGFVQEGIQLALQHVPPEMLINAIPFYSRLWYEVPGGEGEAATVSSVALGMDLSAATALEAGVEFVWNSEVRMYYAQWQDPDGSFRAWLEGRGLILPLAPPSGGTYRIWLEDSRSLGEKLAFMKEHNLAGVASWRLGLENESAWDVISAFMN